MRSITLAAPAKVNLFLKVLKKRKDGYHDILTLFERITVSDRIRISRIKYGINLTTDIPVTNRPEDNIAYKAAKLIIDRCGIHAGAEDGSDGKGNLLVINEGHGKMLGKIKGITDSFLAEPLLVLVGY